MEARLNTLASNITSMIREFLETEVGEYRENYEYMLGSPLCLRLLREIDTLKAKNEKLSKPNIELEINEDENESSYEYDRKYKNDTSKSYKFTPAVTATQEEQNDSECVEVSDDEEVDDGEEFKENS